MKPIPLTCILGIGALTGLSLAQTPAPEAQPKSASVSELGPAVTGNVLSLGQILASYDFDVTGNDGASLDGWSDTVGVSAAANLVFNNAADFGGRGTGGAFNGSGNQDSSHPTLVMTSPPFQLVPDMTINFDITGGQATTTYPVNLAEVMAQPQSAGTGVQCLALRRLSDDNYELYARRAGNADGYQSGSWDAATLEGVRTANPGEIFVIDWIDSFHGSWGFGMVDNVILSTASPAPGVVELVSPPILVEGAINTGWGGPLESALNDGFAYNPLTPTNPMPATGLTSGANGSGIHGNSGTGSNTFDFELVTPLLDDASNQIVVDLYGRNSNKGRDNNIDVTFFDGTGTVIGGVTGIAIPDVGDPFVRVSSNAATPSVDGSTVTKIRVTGHDNLFTLLELRVANLQTAYNIYAGSNVLVTEVNGVDTNVGQEVTLTSGALVTVLSTGEYTYDPNGVIDVTGAPVMDSFDYTIDYSGGTPSSSTVSVSVTDADQITYVDGSWSVLTVGDPITDADAGTTGDQPATFGTDAFATIAEALLASNDNSTVVVNSGTYAENAALADGKTLVITGADAPGTVSCSGLVVTTGATVDIQGSSSLTLSAGNVSGDIVGSGSLTKDSGDTLTLGGMVDHSGGTTLDGGTVSLSGSANLGTGTITVNSGTQLALSADVTVSGPLSGTAPLEIVGSGTATLILAGDASGFTDTVTVTSGRLGIAPGVTLGGSVSIEDAGGIGGEGAISGNLALGTVAGTGCTLVIDAGTAGALSADALTLNGVTTVEGTPAYDTATAMLSYVTSLTDDSGTATLEAAFVPTSGGRYSVANNAQTIELTVAAPESTTFTGASGFFNWEIGAGEFGDQNWDSSDGFFLNLDNVTFDDSAVGTVDEPFLGTVTVIGNPQPGSITFNNTTAQDYVIAGTAIGGSGGLIKDGDGRVELTAANTFTGDTVVNNGTLVLNRNSNAISRLSMLTVNSGGTVEIAATNSIFRNDPLTHAPIILDGGTLDISAGNHAHIANITLRNGAVWTATSTGSYAGVNSDLDGNVTVEGTSPSTIGPFSFGIRAAILDPEFNVADVTMDSAIDLTVSAALRGGMGYIKTGAGTMFLSGFNDYAGTTTVSEGCLTISDIFAIPADLTKISVAAGAGFGGIVGESNLTDEDFEFIASDVQWDAGGTAQLVIDTGGGTVNVGTDFAAYASTFTILAKGGGTLNLSGDLGDMTVNAEPGTEVTTDPVAADVVVESIDVDDTSVTITFSGGNADVYAGPDLQSWTQIGMNVAPTTFIETDVSNPKRFYLLLPAGSPGPMIPE